MFKPLWTANVWFPKYVPSDIISLNHKDIDNIRLSIAINNKITPWLKPCMVETAEVVVLQSAILVSIGQGDGETKWKGWDGKLLLIRFIMLFVYLFIIK